MLDWLNTHIGTDWASYLGLLLAIVPLIWGAQKVIRKRTITQSAKASGGTILQVGGDLQIGGKRESKSGSK